MWLAEHNSYLFIGSNFHGVFKFLNCLVSPQFSSLAKNVNRLFNRPSIHINAVFIDIISLSLHCTADVSPWPWPRPRIRRSRRIDVVMLYTFIPVFGDGICSPWIVVERILAVPASSAPVERVYSNSGLISRSHRAKMSDKLLKSLCLPSVPSSADCCDGQYGVAIYRLIL